jgi:hypothetical protein
MMMNVKCYQLINGQDVIGEFVDNGDTITLRKPASIHLVPSQNGNQQTFGVALMPFTPYAEFDKVTLYKDKIMLEFDATTDLINNYSKMFGSGIQIANTMP